MAGLIKQRLSCLKGLYLKQKTHSDHHSTICKTTKLHEGSLYRKMWILGTSVAATFQVPRPRTGMRVPSFSSMVLATWVSSMVWNETTSRERQKKNLSTNLLQSHSEFSSSAFALRLQHCWVNVLSIWRVYLCSTCFFRSPFFFMLLPLSLFLSFLHPVLSVQ